MSTPTLALKDGVPYLAFAVQGGDSQDQNLLQFFLNIVEFGMTVEFGIMVAARGFSLRSGGPQRDARNDEWCSE